MGLSPLKRGAIQAGILMLGAATCIGLLTFGLTHDVVMSCRTAFFWCAAVVCGGLVVAWIGRP